MNALPPVVDRVLSCFALGLGYPENIFKEASLNEDVADDMHCLRLSPMVGCLS